MSGASGRRRRVRCEWQHKGEVLTHSISSFSPRPRESTLIPPHSSAERSSPRPAIRPSDFGFNQRSTPPLPSFTAAVHSSPHPHLFIASIFHPSAHSTPGWSSGIITLDLDGGLLLPQGRPAPPGVSAHFLLRVIFVWDEMLKPPAWGATN